MTAVQTAGIAALRRAGALEASITGVGDGAVGIRPGATGWEVAAWGPSSEGLPAGLQGLPGKASETDDGTLLIVPGDAAAAAALRSTLPWLAPRPLGLATSAGTGDRLGMATPGHVAAFRANPGVAPVLAQQSSRELGRTGRTFRDVLDAATFGALASGWRSGYAGDADHLKTVEDVDEAVAAGMTRFTADPVELVPDLPADAPEPDVASAFERIPWSALEDSPAAFAGRYPERLPLDGEPALELSPAALRAAAARFGPAVVQIATMFRHLVTARSGGAPFEFEVAVDEILHRTTPVDHVYLATELQRLGVTWVSLAPRFVGRFEKGVDYIGDRAAYEADVRVHAAISRHFGPYKISVHSGSDKFSIYDATAEATRGLVHLKTSGTSFLVALRTVARTDPDLVRAMWGVALQAYAAGRASYIVSASLPVATDAPSLTPSQLDALFDDPNAREILHVSYGAVLHGEGGADPSLGPRFREAVWANRDAYWASLEEHISRHLRPFERWSNARVNTTEGAS